MEGTLLGHALFAYYCVGLGVRLHANYVVFSLGEKPQGTPAGRALQMVVDVLTWPRLIGAKLDDASVLQQRARFMQKLTAEPGTKGDAEKEGFTAFRAHLQKRRKLGVRYAAWVQDYTQTLVETIFEHHEATFGEPLDPSLIALRIERERRGPFTLAATLTIGSADEQAQQSVQAALDELAART